MLCSLRRSVVTERSEGLDSPMTKLELRFGQYRKNTTTVQRVDLTYNGRQLQQYSDGPNTPPTIERKP